jgi:hypothetical protein
VQGMLKKNILIVVAALFITYPGYAQVVEVVSKEILTLKADGAFYYPKFNNEGDKIAFTTEEYNGVWIYNAVDGTVNKLNELPGAGNQPAFDDAGNLILRSYRFENMKRISTMYSQNLATGSLQPIVEGSKNLYPPVKSGASSIYVVDNGEVTKTSTSLTKSSRSEIIVYIENSKIVLVRNGNKVILEPLGKGNYLWTSISNDGGKLLFTKAGSGTFISDLEGNIIHELGKANYPVWAKADEWILYMNDKDDGYRFISSEIELLNINTSERFNLTNTEDVIEMYPDYSISTDEVVYHTLDGQIIKLKLKFN